MRRKKWRRKRRRPAFQFPKDWGPVVLVSFVKGADDREPNYFAEAARRARRAKLPLQFFEVPGGQTAEQFAEQLDLLRDEDIGAKYFGANDVRLLASGEEVGDAS